jgi:hypothetical protein
LTWEEVRVIEPEFPLEKAEYERIDTKRGTVKGENINE